LGTFSRASSAADRSGGQGLGAMAADDDGARGS
jgi:hypothetical protein